MLTCTLTRCTNLISRCRRTVASNLWSCAIFAQGSKELENECHARCKLQTGRCSTMASAAMAGDTLERKLLVSLGIWCDRDSLQPFGRHTRSNGADSARAAMAAAAAMSACPKARVCNSCFSHMAGGQTLHLSQVANCYDTGKCSAVALHTYADNVLVCLACC